MKRALLCLCAAGLGACSPAEPSLPGGVPDRPPVSHDLGMPAPDLRDPNAEYFFDDQNCTDPGKQRFFDDQPYKDRWGIVFEKYFGGYRNLRGTTLIIESTSPPVVILMPVEAGMNYSCRMGDPGKYVCALNSTISPNYPLFEQKTYRPKITTSRVTDLTYCYVAATVAEHMIGEAAHWKTGKVTKEGVPNVVLTSGYPTASKGSIWAPFPGAMAYLQLRSGPAPDAPMLRELPIFQVGFVFLKNDQIRWSESGTTYFVTFSEPR